LEIGIWLDKSHAMLEVDLRPPSNGDDLWTAVRWQYTTGGTRFHSTVRCNVSGLVHLFQNFERLASTSPRQAANKQPHCALDFPWRCPLRGADRFACVSRRSKRKLLAMISFSNYESHLVSVGQLSLWRPSVTHKRIWVNNRTGKVVDQAERPYIPVVTVCREMAVAALEWYQRQAGWCGVLAWRIKPLTNRKVDRVWLDAMAVKHAGRIRACTFYDL
jgi:hypothetical protein